MRLEILSAGHTADLCSLYERVFGKKVKPSYFEMKYGLNDPARVQCSTVAYFDDRVIGFYGCISVEFCDKERNNAYKVGSACDFILLEEYRGKQVFDHLYRHTLDACVAAKMECIFGFHSEQTWKFSRRQGWVDGHGFSRFHIPFRHPGLARVTRKLFGVPRMRQRVEKALAPYLIDSNLDSYNRMEGKWTLPYDAAFLRSKEFCPHYLIKIEGVLMWVKYDLTLVAGFIRFPDDFDHHSFVAALKKIFDPAGISDLTIHVQNGSPEHLVLSSFLPPLPSFKISYLQLQENGCSFDDLALNFMDADIF